MRRLYLILAVIGFVLPYYFLVSFIVENGLDLPLLINQPLRQRHINFLCGQLNHHRHRLCRFDRHGLSDGHRFLRLGQVPLAGGPGCPGHHRRFPGDGRRIWTRALVFSSHGVAGRRLVFRSKGIA